MGDNARLNLIGQLHVLHGRVSRVNLVLELGRLLIQLRDNQRHITENVRINHGTGRDNHGHKGHLKGTSRHDIVASEEED